MLTNIQTYSARNSCAIRILQYCRSGKISANRNRIFGISARIEDVAVVHIEGHFNLIAKFVAGARVNAGNKLVIPGNQV
jgi:hypothetical protein